jgi:hypothetical protein
MGKRIGGFLAVAVALALVGCSSQSKTPTEPRSPTSPEQVAIYQKHPNKYQDLGVVTVPIGGRIRMDDRGDATAGFEELKKQAAAKGANGLLLDGNKIPSNLTVTAGYNGTFYQVPVDNQPRTAKAHAIWVYKD